MNIKRIIAHNFMSCKHIEVDIDSHLNIIVGESDSGKTTLFKRSLDWCLFNSLSGDYFVRNNDEGKVDKKGELIKEDECYVTVIFDNDSKITRKRIKGKNIYEITDENGEFFPFENFGNNIPDKVFEISGMKKIIVDKDLSLNLNIPNKKENGILSTSNGVKAKIVGSFAGTNVIDAAIRELQSDTKNNSSNIKFIEEEINKIDLDIEKLGDIKEKEEKLKKCDDLLNRYKEKEEKIFFLKDLDRTINSTKEIIETLQKTINSKEYINECYVRYTELELKLKSILEKKNKYETFINLYNSIEELKKDISVCNKLINSKNDVLNREKLLLKKEKEINEYILKINELENKRNNISTIFNNINRSKEEIEKYNLFISKKEKLQEKEEYLLDITQKISEINKHYKAINTIQDALVESKNIIDTAKKKERDGIIVLNKMKDDLNADIIDYLEKIKKLGKCPTCSANITPEHLSKLKEELLK